MLVLLATLNEDRFPGEITIADLVAAVRRIASRTKVLRDEFGVAFDDDEALSSSLVKNPINAWAGGAGTGGLSYFRYEDGTLSTTFDCVERDRPALQNFTRELAEWRLAEHLASPSRLSGDHEFVCKIIHSNGQPIIKLPDRAKHPTLPSDWTTVLTETGTIEAKFVKIAINVAREPGGDQNILPQLMRSWFGPDAGLPGTYFQVRFSHEPDGLHIAPLNRVLSGDGAQLWKAYSREQIPGLFGFEFSTGSWNQGFIAKEGHLFLLATLEKGDMADNHQYSDHFESSDTFAWQSQARTTQGSRHGRLISNHVHEGISVHLLVRKTKKIGSRAAPFIYCGEVSFVRWEGEKPINVTWHLAVPLPDHIFQALIE